MGDGPMISGTSWQIIEGDCLKVLPRIEPVDAIVTSPPYADQRKNSYAGDYRWEDAYEWFGPYAEAMLSACTGSLMLNVGRLVREGCERPLAEDLRRAAVDAGWLWIDSLVWSKPNAIISSSTAYLHSTHEHVWWLARSTDVYRGYDHDTRTPHAPESIKRWKQGYRMSDDKESRYHKRGKKIPDPHPDGARPKTVFSAAIGQTRGLKHTAPMPLKLAEHLVCLSCPVGGTVLDPFAGSGTTVLAATRKDRSGIGIEVGPEKVIEAQNRIRDDAPLFNNPSEAAA